MNIIDTEFDELFIIQHRVFSDDRGIFVKTFNQETFKSLGINLDIKERYYSISHKNVIRGMHFQTPPSDHVKLVTVLAGSITDVVLDIRKNSSTFGKYFEILISAEEGKTIHIPKGFAHGFKVLEDNTIVEYNQTTGYDQQNDAGIRYDSFGFNWKVENNPAIISERDLTFSTFSDFKTPF